MNKSFSPAPSGRPASPARPANPPAEYHRRQVDAEFSEHNAKPTKRTWPGYAAVGAGCLAVGALINPSSGSEPATAPSPVVITESVAGPTVTTTATQVATVVETKVVEVPVDQPAQPQQPAEPAQQPVKPQQQAQQPVQPQQPQAANQPYFANCSEVRAAGRAPIRRGEPGYRPALDRDGDGLACEK